MQVFSINYYFAMATGGVRRSALTGGIRFLKNLTADITDIADKFRHPLYPQYNPFISLCGDKIFSRRRRELGCIRLSGRQ
jgi:hypothetical protein